MSRKLLAVSLVAAASVATLVLQLEPKALYAYSVRDFLSREVRAREVRVAGQLVHGTLCQVPADCGYRFAVSDSARASAEAANVPTLAVHYDGCQLPDTFRDVSGYDITISVEGERCQTCHDLRATRIMAKCPAKYQLPTYTSYSSRPPPLCARGAEL